MTWTSADASFPPGLPHHPPTATHRTLAQYRPPSHPRSSLTKQRRKPSLLLFLSITTQPSTQRIQVLRNPLPCLIQPRVSPGPTVIKSRLCPRLRLCCPHLHRRLCRFSSRRGSFRLGPSVAKLPLLASPRPPWTMVSIVRILLHPPSYDQPPRRASRARLGPPHLQRFLPGSPVPTVPIRFPTDAVTPAPPSLGILPPDAPRRARTPAALPEIPSPTEIEFIESVERYTHSDRAREQRAEPVCDAAIRYRLLDSPSILPNDFFVHLAPDKRPPLSDLRSLADTGRLYTDDDRVLRLAQSLTPPALACPGKPGGRAAPLLDDEPTRIYVPLHMHP